MPTLTSLCTIVVTLDFTPIGKVGTGLRIDVPFSGVATSSHWDGERPVEGVDYVTIDGNGIQQLDIRGRIGTGKEVVSYRAVGRGNEAGPMELLVFETANEELAHLNSTIAVAVGSVDGNQLTLDVSAVER
ncbi:DUF3237 family protein [Ilumatobacter coccineus]|uniref:DUF3237 domain-containing protein n=1 Tax=Ilumatobacter coccineus (strain NBRC 103263 / KCTC 29153 / YM16-304) TaxID=1313172 RepID=A0A6C7E122_ILUCY|nr:DUF3237 family protein [Ilumatobacter coccineus]BAN00631.1 hypothetical protein YM304_03170 [Ilumatobacter coccineus YM16-304]